MRRSHSTAFLAATGGLVAAVGMLSAVSRAQAPYAPAASQAGQLIASAQPSPLLGKPAPDFTLADQNDKMHSLTEAKGKWVVLAFYPKDETTGCTLQNKSYTAGKDRFAPLNAVVYTVSTQDTASKRAFCDKDALTHTLLADVGGKVAQEYGVYMPTSGLAKRVTFYIRPDGTVADVDTHIRVATAADDSVTHLKALQATSGASAPSAAAAVAGPPHVGDTLADFTLPDAATGASHSLKDLARGEKAVAFIFVSTQCPVSNAYNERMEKIAEDYSSKGIRVVGINANKAEPTDDIVSHAKANNLTFPILKDSGNKIADRLDAQVTPEVFLVDPNGVLLYHGPIDDKQNPSAVTHTYLKDALDAVISGQAVAVKSARAFGCSIKRVAPAS